MCRECNNDSSAQFFFQAIHSDFHRPYRLKLVIVVVAGAATIDDDDDDDG